MFKEFVKNFKKLNMWQQALFVIFFLGIIIFALFHLNIIKLPAAKAYDCDDVEGYLTINVKIGEKFEPSNIDAFVCDHLKFTAIDDAGHWPAVGPHPTHTSYPGFDAQRDLKKGESYEIALNRPGTYSFHDHSHPEIVGNIVIHGTPRRANPPPRP